MRNMSFAMTLEHFYEGSKTVTRRTGWTHLKPGDKVMGVEKAMGLKPGEKIVKIRPVEIVSITREPLNHIANYGAEEMIREGLPGMSPEDYITMFMKAYGCSHDAIITRIAFAHDWEGGLQ